MHYSFISISTPAGKSNLIKESTVLGDGLTISINLLWVLISNCSLESLYLWTALNIVIISFSVGSGTGPDYFAPVFLAVSTIFSAEWSNILWSKAFNLILIFCFEPF